MKIEREAEKFVPITVTFETYEEAAAIMAVCGQIACNDKSIYHAATNEVYYTLEKFGVVPARVKFLSHSLEFTK